MSSPADRFDEVVTLPVDEQPPLEDPSQDQWRRDPALAVWADFTIQMKAPLRIGTGSDIVDFYDRGAHRYQDHYIRSTEYELRLDAVIGLRNGASQPGNAIMSKRLDPIHRPRIKSIDDIIGQTEPELLDPGSPGSPLIPDHLLSFSWLVRSSDGEFRESKFVQRPTNPMQLVVFALPGGAGEYDIRLRVFFADRRFGERSVSVNFDDRLMVSLGDSYASGEGNPNWPGSVDTNLGGGVTCNSATLANVFEASPKMSNDPDWWEPSAHRSRRSGHARAAQILDKSFVQTITPDGEQVDKVRLVKITFASFARTGATVFKGLIDPQADDILDDFIGAGQIEECRRTILNRPVDALLVSIGGNDVGFAGTLKDLVKNDSIFSPGLSGPARATYRPDIGDDDFARDRVERRLSHLLGVGLPSGQKGPIELQHDIVHDNLQELRKRPGVGAVYLCGYPTGLFDVPPASDSETGFRACGVFKGPDLDVDRDDGDLITRHGARLNDLLERKAREFRWHFVDIADLFSGHGYCAEDTYFVGSERSCRQQGNFDGTMHPNEKGHAAYTLRLLEAFRSHRFPGLMSEDLALDE